MMCIVGFYKTGPIAALVSVPNQRQALPPQGMPWELMWRGADLRVKRTRVRAPDPHQIFTRGTWRSLFPMLGFCLFSSEERVWNKNSKKTILKRIRRRRISCVNQGSDVNGGLLGRVGTLPESQQVGIWSNSEPRAPTVQGPLGVRKLSQKSSKLTGQFRLWGWQASEGGHRPLWRFSLHPHVHPPLLVHMQELRASADLRGP